MKVKCQLCGKKFTLEANDNRCPKCATYYHMDGQGSNHTQLNGMYVSNYNESKHYEKSLDFGNGYEYEEDEDEDDALNQEIHEMYQNQRRQQERTRNKTKKIIKGIVITVEVFLIIFFLLMPSLGQGYSDLCLEKQKVTEKPIIAEAKMNKPIAVNDYELTATVFYVDDMEKWNLPDNYMVYAVEYEAEYVGDDYYGGGLYNLVEPYLETASGPTIAPLDNYTVGEFMDYEEYKSLDDEIGNFIKSSGGILYFVVKEDEEIYGLCFDVYVGRESDDYYKELDKVYFIEAPELGVK